MKKAALLVMALCLLLVLPVSAADQLRDRDRQYLDNPQHTQDPIRDRDRLQTSRPQFQDSFSTTSTPLQTRDRDRFRDGSGAGMQYQNRFRFQTGAAMGGSGTFQHRRGGGSRR